MKKEQISRQLENGFTLWTLDYFEITAGEGCLIKNLDTGEVVGKKIIFFEKKPPNIMIFKEEEF